MTIFAIDPSKTCNNEPKSSAELNQCKSCKTSYLEHKAYLAFTLGNIPQCFPDVSLTLFKLITKNKIGLEQQRTKRYRMETKLKKNHFHLSFFFFLSFYFFFKFRVTINSTEKSINH